MGAAMLVCCLIVLAGGPGRGLAQDEEPEPKNECFKEIQIGLSVQKRPVTATVWNEGENPTIILCAIHGNERLAGEFGLRLDVEWQDDPEDLNGAYVILIPIANPDGWKRWTKKNANHVDLNRNFPGNWEPSRRGSRHYSGPEPLSEPETRIIVDLIERTKPSRIISVHSPLHNINYDGPALELAKVMAKHNHYPIVDQIGYPTPGSLGNYAGKDRNIPTITLELPKRAAFENIWPANYKAVLAAVKFKLKSH